MGLLTALFGGSERDRFARKVSDRIKARGWPGPEPEYFEDTFSLRLDDQHRLFLDNAFKAWSRAKTADKDHQIDVAIGFLFEPRRDATLAEAKAHLLPAIRNRADLTNLWLAPGNGSVRGAYAGALHPFCRDLVVTLVVDGQSSISYVTRSKLEDWGTSFDDALTVAIENLRSISPCKFEKEPGGYWISSYGDHQDAARLLLPHLFEQLDLLGEPVTVALDRATLLVTGSDDHAAVRNMSTFCENNFGKTDRPLACLPLALRHGQWTPLERGADGHPALDRLRAIQQLRDCAEQKALLDAHNGASGDGPFVAGLRSSVHGGGCDTWAMWKMEIDTLLPRADVIAFSRGDNEAMESRWRSWTDVEAQFGLLTQEPDLYPPRYRLREWPRDAWERIEKLPKPVWASS